MEAVGALAYDQRPPLSLKAALRLFARRLSFKATTFLTLTKHYKTI